MLLQGSPDPLVRKVIAIDTLLKELNCRITIQFRGFTALRISSVILLCFSTWLFIPQVARASVRSADSGDVKQ